MEKLSSTKLIPGAKKVGDPWIKGLFTRMWVGLKETDKERQGLLANNSYCSQVPRSGGARGGSGHQKEKGETEGGLPGKSCGL